MKRSIILILLSFLSSRMYSQDMFVFKENIESKKKGVLNHEGKIILPCKFDYINYTSYLIEVKEGSENGKTLYDVNGNFIVNNFIFFSVLQNRKHLLVKEYSKNNDGKWGLWGLNGKSITGYIYDNIETNPLLEDFAIVIKDSIKYLINADGKTLFYNKNDKIFEDSITLFINKMYPEELSNAEAVEAVEEIDYEIFKDEKTSKFGVKLNNNQIISPIYDEIKEVCCENFVVKKGLKYGLIDNQGKIILDIIFDKIAGVSGESIIVAQGSKYGIYSRQSGKVIITTTYELIDFISNSLYIK